MMPASKRLIKFGEHVAPLNPLRIGLNYQDQYYVDYEDCYVKDGITLIGLYGVGDSIEDACEDYLEKIIGKILVFNPTGEDRRKEVFAL